jgi:transcriptional regulator with XRE-family HTH domain
MSQLDLAVAADVSARHISFLETGRSLPSAEMVVLLGATLGVPLTQVNAMLVAAGHDPVFEESEAGIPKGVRQAVDLLKSHHEPFPLIVLDGAYNVVDLNRADTTASLLP